jgi:hypothetical protein
VECGNGFSKAYVMGMRYSIPVYTGYGKSGVDCVTHASSRGLPLGSSTTYYIQFPGGSVGVVEFVGWYSKFTERTVMVRRTDIQ